MALASSVAGRRQRALSAIIASSNRIAVTLGVDPLATAPPCVREASLLEAYRLEHLQGFLDRVEAALPALTKKAPVPPPKKSTKELADVPG